MKTYTFLEAVDLMKTSETTLSELLITGAVAGAKIGQHWCIMEEDIHAFMRKEVERQTKERIDAAMNGERPKVKTARGQRTFKPDLDKMAA